MPASCSLSVAGITDGLSGSSQHGGFARLRRPTGLRPGKTSARTWCGLWPLSCLASEITITLWSFANSVCMRQSFARCRQHSGKSLRLWPPVGTRRPCNPRPSSPRSPRRTPAGQSCSTKRRHGPPCRPRKRNVPSRALVRLAGACLQPTPSGPGVHSDSNDPPCLRCSEPHPPTTLGPRPSHAIRVPRARPPSGSRARSAPAWSPAAQQARHA